MGSFLSRDIHPIDFTYPAMPTGLLSPSQSGKTQFRAIHHLGRQWAETFGIIDQESDVGRAFVSELAELYRNGSPFTIAHLGLFTLRGTGGGTPLVNGASQTGSSIVTDGWPNSTTVLKAGDLVRFLGSAPNVVRDVTANVVSNGSGQAAIPINPPIFAGSAPSNDSVVDYGAGLAWRVRVVGVEWPTGRHDLLSKVSGLRVIYREALDQ